MQGAEYGRSLRLYPCHVVITICCLPRRGPRRTRPAPWQHARVRNVRCLLPVASVLLALVLQHIDGGRLSFRNQVSVTLPLLVTAPWIFAARMSHAVVFGPAESRETLVLSLLPGIPGPSLIDLDPRWKQDVKPGGQKTHRLTIDAIRGIIEQG